MARDWRPLLDEASTDGLADVVREVLGQDGRWCQGLCWRFDSPVLEEGSAEVARLIDDHCDYYEYDERVWHDWREPERTSRHIRDVVREVTRRPAAVHPHEASVRRGGMPCAIA